MTKIWTRVETTLAMEWFSGLLTSHRIDWPATWNSRSSLLATHFSSTNPYNLSSQEQIGKKPYLCRK